MSVQRVVCLLGLVIASSWKATSVAEASTITLTGVAQGCFGLDCTDFSSNPSQGDVSFLANPDFTVTIDDSGPDSITAVGTFMKAGNTLPTLPGVFRLQLDFANTPTVTPDMPIFDAQTSTTGQSLKVYFDFDGTQAFTFSGTGPTGAFELTISDFQLHRDADSYTLTPILSNASFTPAITTLDPAPVPVPEPASLLLFGTGLAAVTARLRRRRAQ